MANEIKTMDDLHGAYPALANGIEEATAQQARSDGRQRIQDVEGMALPDSEEQTLGAKYIKPTSASTYAKVAARKTREQGNTWLNRTEDDVECPDGARKETPGNDEQDESMDAIKSMGGRR